MEHFDDLEISSEADKDKLLKNLQNTANMVPQRIQEVQELYQKKILEYYSELNGKMYDSSNMSHKLWIIISGQTCLS